MKLTKEMLRERQRSIDALEMTKKMSKALRNWKENKDDDSLSNLLKCSNEMASKQKDYE